MKPLKLAVGVAGLALIAAGAGGAVAAKTPKVPKTAVVKQKYSLVLKPNRYIQDGMRFDKDTYTVKSGGTLKLILNKPQEGPHSLTAVTKKDLPKTGDQAFNHCKPCNKLGKAHGFDPNSQGPPKFQYLENGVGQNKPSHFDRAGDSGITGPKKGSTIHFKVTAKPNTTLHIMCIVHPWMQVTVLVK
jgi:uncharacterized cupredoxin-like copper-binding protein